MIKSFKTRETEKIFSRQRSAQIPEEVQRIALRNLRTLDRAAAVQDDWLPASEYTMWRLSMDMAQVSAQGEANESAAKSDDERHPPAIGRAA